MSYLITGSALSPFEVPTLREAITAVEEYSRYGHRGMKIWYPPEESFVEPPEAAAVGCAARMTASDVFAAQIKENARRAKEALKILEIPPLDTASSPSPGIDPPFDFNKYLNKEKVEDFVPDFAAQAKQESTLGRKFDGGKLRISLVPMDVFQEVLEVLEFGATKYAPDNWKHVENPNERYLNAAFRHLFLAKNGPRDEESGKLHVAHAICCLLFLGWFDLEDERYPF